MTLSDIKVGTKLLAGFILVAAVVAIVGTLGIVNLDRLMATADEILQVDMELADSAMEANIAHMHIRDLSAEVVFEEDPAEMARAEKAIVEFDARLVRKPESSDNA